MQKYSDEPPVFGLPNEVLMKIFLHFVDDKYMPLTLTHVCRLWRELAHHIHGLWRTIDLHSLQQAKQFVALAPNAHLRVSWDDVYTRARTCREKYNWLWVHANRFSHVSLTVIPSNMITYIFARMGSDLLELLDLTIESHDRNSIAALSPRMSKLRNLHLS